MIAVWMVQAAVDQIVGMITMRYRFMTAFRAVAMRRIVAAATVFRAAAVRIGGADLDNVHLYMPVVWILQMPVVQVIHVPLVTDRLSRNQSDGALLRASCPNVCSLRLM
jgi:hypothetical protein